MPKTTYAKVESSMTSCNFCKKNVTLLYHMCNQQRKAMFFICWHCERIFEAGKGEVKTENGESTN